VAPGQDVYTVGYYVSYVQFSGDPYPYIRKLVPVEGLECWGGWEPKGPGKMGETLAPKRCAGISARRLYTRGRTRQAGSLDGSEEADGEDGGMGDVRRP
jgi:hypothetical protein